MTMTRYVLAALMILAGVAHADPDPKRKVVVLEYRAPARPTASPRSASASVRPRSSSSVSASSAT